MYKISNGDLFDNKIEAEEAEKFFGLECMFKDTNFEDHIDFEEFILIANDNPHFIKKLLKEIN